MSNIKQLRKDLGMTQIELAKALGISQGHLSMVENGTTQLMTGAIDKYNKLLRMAILTPKVAKQAHKHANHQYILSSISRLESEIEHLKKLLEG